MHAVYCIASVSASTIRYMCAALQQMLFMTRSVFSHFDSPFSFQSIIIPGSRLASTSLYSAQWPQLLRSPGTEAAAYPHPFDLRVTVELCEGRLEQTLTATNTGVHLPRATPPFLPVALAAWCRRVLCTFKLLFSAFYFCWHPHYTNMASLRAILHASAGAAPMAFTGALHTYFRVRDISQAMVVGLQVGKTACVLSLRALAAKVSFFATVCLLTDVHCNIFTACVFNTRCVHIRKWTVFMQRRRLPHSISIDSVMNTRFTGPCRPRRAAVTRTA